MLNLFHWNNPSELPPDTSNITLQLINQKLDRILSIIDKPPIAIPYTPSVTPALTPPVVRDNQFITELNSKITEYRANKGMGALGSSVYNV